jgi:ParB/RepB/Spo0J family partition protein
VSKKKAPPPTPTAPAGDSPPPTPAPPPGEFAVLPLADICPSPHNARKTFDAGELNRLADSIREKGVLEPVVVRPWPADDQSWSTGQEDPTPPKYQLVAGERRWRASLAVGYATIPAVVRDLDDKEAAEVGVIENDQRADVPPLEQAEGYEHLIRLGDDVEVIAAKIGRPAKYVAGRLQLLNLAPKLQQDLRGGKLPFGHAWLLSRLPAADQEDLHGRLYEEWGANRGSPCSLAALKERIRNSRLHPLSAARWKWDDADLVPSAGSCTACPKRSGNNRTLFDELLDPADKKAKQEYCTDGGCYRGKQEAFIQLQVRKVAEKNGGEALKVSEKYEGKGSDVLGRDRYEVLTAKEAKAAEKEKPGTVKRAVVVDGYDAEGLGKEVFVRVKAERKGGGPADDSYKRERAEAQKKQEDVKAASALACGQVAGRMAKAMEGRDYLPLLRQVLAAVADMAGADACRLVGKRRGLAVQAADTRACVEQFALDTAADEVELVALAAELAAAKRAVYWQHSHGGSYQSDEDKAFWAAFGVNKAELVKAAADERKEAKGGKKGAAAKPAKKPAKKKAVA